MFIGLLCILLRHLLQMRTNIQSIGNKSVRTRQCADTLSSTEIANRNLVKQNNSINVHLPLVEGTVSGKFRLGKKNFSAIISEDNFFLVRKKSDTSLLL